MLHAIVVPGVEGTSVHSRIVRTHMCLMSITLASITMSQGASGFCMTLGCAQVTIEVLAISDMIEVE